MTNAAGGSHPAEPSCPNHEPFAEITGRQMACCYRLSAVSPWGEEKVKRVEEELEL